MATQDEDTFDLENVQPWTTLPWCSTMVFTPDYEWVELRCKECGGNASLGTKELYKGATAFHSHLIRIHDYKAPLKMVDVLAACTYRYPPKHELGVICWKKEAWMPYVPLVHAQTSERPAPAPKTENKDGDVSWEFAKDPLNRIEGHDCVVRHPSDGHWYELECPICHGNSSPNHGFLKGPKAMFDHLCNTHRDKCAAKGPVELIERCQIRKFTEEEVAKLFFGSEDAPTSTTKPIRSESNSLS